MSIRKGIAATIVRSIDYFAQQMDRTSSEKEQVPALLEVIEKKIQKYKNK